MQLYGYKDGDLFFVDEAKKGLSYLCPCCGTEVRVKGGRFLSRHFFHTKKQKRCAFYQKSLRHLAIQRELKRLIPSIELERRFEEPHRIGDAYWPEKKIVFEVQTSMITAMEVERRERDYNLAGIEIIWILSDSLFNKRYVRPAEKILRQKSTYYTNAGFNMKGVFYDQFEVFNGSQRKFKLPPLPINLRRPKKMPKKRPHALPKIASVRENRSHTYFYGDLYDRSLHFEAYRKALLNLERKHCKTPLHLLRDYALGEASDLCLYYKKKFRHDEPHTDAAKKSREKLQPLK